MEHKETAKAPRKLPYRGGAVGLLLLLVLVTPPTEILESAGAYADTRGDIRSSAATPIHVNDGLTADPTETIPRVLGNWTGTDDDSWPELLQDTLQYDALLVRHYTRPGFFEPVQVMVLSGRHAEAFHNPTVCFRSQGNAVLLMDDTTIDFGGRSHAVGRMVVDDGARPKIVYNLYLVEEKFASPARTTWIRLSYSGADLETESQLRPYLLDLMDEIAPHAFQGREAARTTIGAVYTAAGLPFALLAGMVPVVPAGVEWLIGRKR